MTDMYADAVVTVVLRAESDPMPQKSEKNTPYLHSVRLFSLAFYFFLNSDLNTVTTFSLNERNESIDI